jgi:hypothetical protein
MVPLESAADLPFVFSNSGNTGFPKSTDGRRPGRPKEIQMAQTSPAPAAQHTERKHSITVDVVYNGVTKVFEFQPQQTVQSVLEQAMNAFGIRDQRHLQALFREDNTEVTPENVSLKDAGIVEGTVLAPRPSRVKGGA